MIRARRRRRADRSRRRRGVRSALGYHPAAARLSHAAPPPTMGRKKGKQSLGFGKEFHSKSQRAQYRQTLFVDEADEFRNPCNADLGRGHGYRSAVSTDVSAGSGYWHTNGSSYGGGDKWSSIFNSRSSSGGGAARPQLSTSNANRATAGLSHLRHLLAERQTEDRVHDRQHRLRLHRSRMMDAQHDISCSSMQTPAVDCPEENERHEPGWLLSFSPGDSVNALGNIDETLQPKNDIPTLQQLAARSLGPLLPMYCAACGSDFVGESLKSLSASVLAELAISLANSDWSSQKNFEQGDNIFATTDGAVKALVHSGVATGLVLRGAPLVPFDTDTICEKAMNNDDTRWLGDDGLVSICPRLLSADDEGGMGARYNPPKTQDDESSGSCNHWESLDFDMGLNSRMAGCFYLKRLELIDIPLMQRGEPSTGGISLEALRTALRACSNITHLSLSGCFYNWEDVRWMPGEANDINTLLCGNTSLPSVASAMKVFARLRGNGEAAMHLIPKLYSHQLFREDNEKKSEVFGLDTLLPELRVLDLSHCSWVTPGLLIQFVFKLWERAFLSAAEEGDSSMDSQWEENGDVLSTKNGNKSDERQMETTLQHINIRDCTGLLASSSLPSWMNEWIECGLFDGMDISVDRQVRT
ncbi:hypothetical protein ACHAXT_002335 [Thalassiosira profunda]